MKKETMSFSRFLTVCLLTFFAIVLSIAGILCFVYSNECYDMAKASQENMFELSEKSTVNLGIGGIGNLSEEEKEYNNKISQQVMLEASQKSKWTAEYNKFQRLGYLGVAAGVITLFCAIILAVTGSKKPKKAPSFASASGTAHFCPRCSTRYSTDQKFCNNCGYAFNNNNFSNEKELFITTHVVSLVLIVVAIVFLCVCTMEKIRSSKYEDIIIVCAIGSFLCELASTLIFISSDSLKNDSIAQMWRRQSGMIVMGIIVVFVYYVNKALL